MPGPYATLNREQTNDDRGPRRRRPVTKRLERTDHKREIGYLTTPSLGPSSMSAGQHMSQTVERQSTLFCLDEAEMMDGIF